MYGMIGVIIALLFYDNVDVWVILAQFFSAIVMLFATHLLRYKMKLDGWLKLKIKQLIVRLVPTLIILALLANGIITGYTVLSTDLIPVDKISPTVFLLFAFQTFIYFCLWTAVYLIIYFFRNYKKAMDFQKHMSRDIKTKPVFTSKQTVGSVTVGRMCAHPYRAFYIIKCLCTNIPDQCACCKT